MASVIFSSTLSDALSGKIDFKKDRFKVMLCTSDYEPDKDVHTKRSDVTHEISGFGYVKGGIDVDMSVLNDVINHRIDVTLGEAVWPNSTITARRAVYYKSHGGSPALDELVAVIDFSRDVASTSGNFRLTPSILRIQN